MRQKHFTLPILIFCVLTWGSSYVAIKIGLNSFSPTQVASYRFAVAGLISFLCLLFGHVRMPNRKQILHLLLVAFLGIFLYHISITYYTVHFEPNVVSFVSNTAPVFILIFSRYLLKENQQHIRWMGFWLAMIGVGCMNYQKGIAVDWNHIGLLSIPLTSALFFVLQKPLLQEMKSTDMMNFCILFGSIMLLIWDCSFISVLPTASFDSHFAIIFLGLVPTIIAFQLWSYLLSKSNVSDLSSPIYLIPLSTMLFSFLVLDRVPGVMTIIGGAITTMGVLFSRRNRDNVT